MKMFCKHCNVIVRVYGEVCPDCGNTLKQEFRDKINDNICTECGGRGRAALDKKTKQKKVLCFNCYHGISENEVLPASWSEEKKEYFISFRQNYLKPLYYGEKPDLDAIPRPPMV